MLNYSFIAIFALLVSAFSPLKGFLKQARNQKIFFRVEKDSYDTSNLSPKQPIEDISSQKIIRVPQMSSAKPNAEIAKLNFLKENVYNSSNSTKVFDDTIKFPTKFTLKVIGDNAPEFVEDIVEITASALGIQPTQIEYSIRDTSGGKYIAITLTPYFKTSNELYNCYTAISKDARVKFCI